MKNIIKKIKENIHDWFATLMGLLVTITVAWQAVDWNSFSLKRDWIKLVISAIPAIGGYITELKKKNNGTDTSTDSSTSK